MRVRVHSSSRLPPAGVRMRASFVSAEAAAAAVQAGKPFPYGRRKWQHWFRRWNIR